MSKTFDMNNFNYRLTYIAINNFIRRKPYSLIPKTPDRWKFRNRPYFIKNISRNCAFTSCNKCKFAKEVKGGYFPNNLCMFKIIIENK